EELEKASTEQGFAKACMEAGDACMEVCIARVELNRACTEAGLLPVLQEAPALVPSGQATSNSPGAQETPLPPSEGSVASQRRSTDQMITASAPVTRGRSSGTESRTEGEEASEAPSLAEVKEALKPLEEAIDRAHEAFEQAELACSDLEVGIDQTSETRE